MTNNLISTPQIFSVEQKNELEVLNSCLTLDEKKNKWHFEGKYRENLSNLPTYEHQVKKGMEGFKNRLMKNSRGKEIAESLDKTVKENLEAGNYQWEKDAIAEQPTPNRCRVRAGTAAAAAVAVVQHRLSMVPTSCQLF